MVKSPEPLMMIQPEDYASAWLAYSEQFDATTVFVDPLHSQVVDGNQSRQPGGHPFVDFDLHHHQVSRQHRLI